MTEPELDRAIVWLSPSAVRRIRRSISARRGTIAVLTTAAAEYGLEPLDADETREYLEELDELEAIDAQLAAFLRDVGGS